ncbi:hypothetical protein BH18ACT11_BH18ACT11_20680 [soil metagenome]
MRSRRGFLGAIVLLSAFPVAVLAQVLLGSGSSVTIHLVLALGCALLSLAVFDFETPRWIAWMGRIATGTFAAIFLVQAASELIHNDSFSYFALQVLGNWPERVLTTSRDNMRILGIVAMATAVLEDAYNYVLLFLCEAQALKILYLVPFVWLLFESRKKLPGKGS